MLRLKLRPVGLMALAAGACVWLSIDVEVLHAQSSRGTSGTGMFGGRTLGGGIQSNRQSSAGQGGAGGAAGVGAAPGNGAMLQQAQEGVGEVGGSDRFLRENRQGAFVGADTGEVGNTRSLMNNAAMPNFGNIFGNLFQGREFNANNNATRGQTPLRIPIRLGFEAKPVVTSEFTSKFANRLSKLPELQVRSPIEVTMEGSIAVLRGTVASEADRKLAGDLAMLEPQVAGVKNELVVGPAETTGEELPLTQPSVR